MQQMCCVHVLEPRNAGTPQWARWLPDLIEFGITRPVPGELGAVDRGRVGVRNLSGEAGTLGSIRRRHRGRNGLDRGI
jgi:hypothetical protein